MVKICSNDYLIERVLGILTYLYGPYLKELLKNKIICVEYNPNLDRIKQVYVNESLKFTIRTSDGYLLPTINCNDLIKSEVVISDDAVEFIKKGRSVITKSIVKYKNVEPGIEVFIKDRYGNLLALGRLILSPEEFKLKRGIAVKIRKHT